MGFNGDLMVIWWDLTVVWTGDLMGFNGDYLMGFNGDLDWWFNGI